MANDSLNPIGGLEADSRMSERKPTKARKTKGAEPVVRIKRESVSLSSGVRVKKAFGVFVAVVMAWVTVHQFGDELRQTVGQVADWAQSYLSSMP